MTRAPRWASIASLIATAKLNDVNPYAYLKAKLEAIAAGHLASDVDRLVAAIGLYAGFKLNSACRSSPSGGSWPCCAQRRDV